MPRRIKILRTAAYLTLGLTQSVAAQLLTERQAIQMLREGPHRQELQADVDEARAEALRHSFYPNPSANTSVEGAGRTEFYWINQPLLLNGRQTLLRQAAGSAVLAAESGAAHGLRQVEADMRRRYYELSYVQARKQLISESMPELERVVRALRVREAEGDASRLDRLRGEREIAEVETDLAEAETLISVAQARLAGFFGEAVSPANLYVQGSLEAAYGLPPIEDAIESGLTARADYRMEAEILERFRLEGEAATRQRIPNPVVGAGVKRADVGHQLATGPFLGVSVDLPLFDRGQVESRLADAKASRARARMRIVESQVVSDVRATYEALLQRRQIARNYRLEAVARSEELLRITRVAYQEGEIGILELMEAIRDAQVTNLRQLELQAAAKLAEVEFDRGIGRELLP